jgi:hypothetical protein
MIYYLYSGGDPLSKESWKFWSYFVPWNGSDKIGTPGVFLSIAQKKCFEHEIEWGDNLREVEVELVEKIQKGFVKGCFGVFNG